MDLKQKNNFIIDQMDSLQAFLKVLEEVKSREKLLTFEPIADPFEKLNELKHIKQIHVSQILKSEEQANQVEDTLVAYN